MQSGGVAAAAVPVHAAVGGGGGGAAAAPPPPFLMKTYEMVDDPATDGVVSWGPGNNSFIVWNTPEFARDLLPKYFKHSNFSSFVRQLNTYGFRKVDPDRWEFANEGFLRGQKHLLKTINRRKPSLQGNSQPQQPQLQNAPVPSCVEVGKFGLEEEIERLKRDKNVLMQELVRLRQQQQTTDHQLQTLGKRLQGMESRQQQMMSFLAKAMQSPGFLAQFVQRNENSRRRIVAANKKRRLPKQDGLESESSAASLDGQIIKYQPSINEAAKAMLRKILNVDSSHMFESMGNSDNSNNNNNNLLEDYMPAGQAFESSSSTRNSGVTLAEVPANSGLAYVGTSSAICSPPAAPEMQCPVVLDNKAYKQVASMSAVPPVSSDMGIIPEFSDLADLVSVDILGGAFEMMPGPEFPLPEEGDDGTTMYNNNDEEAQSLPGIVNSIWEQFLVGSPLSTDNEEVDSAGGLYAQEDGWSKVGNIANLTEQMGLVSSTNHRDSGNGLY
ncbi:Heat stress transcription factor A-1 [Zea mays]|uniref:Heat shock transcription factor n=2 Tax=Zea mays TaxID=4577 RepID=A0A5J6CYL4_MAIZE|nr:Heat stress transcription factor A-1 [Zea mays]QEQ56174.1 heat shock transcription factor [Zea mays]